MIKIEPPGGEKMRRRGSVGGGAMLPFAMLNSNKEFVTVNLKSEAGRKLFFQLVRKADVVIENFAPGVMDRLGVGPAACCRRTRASSMPPVRAMAGRAPIAIIWRWT